MVEPAVRSYKYKKPRKINLVSVAIAILAVGAGYWLLRFGPHYWKRGKVDQALEQGLNEAGNIWAQSAPNARRIEGETIRSTTARIEGLGYSRTLNQLVVYFTPGYSQFCADYVVTIKHPGNVVKPSTLKMHRCVKIDRSGGF